MPDVINWLKAATNYIFRLQKSDQRMHRECTAGAPKQQAGKSPKWINISKQ